MDLKALLQELREYDGLTGKSAIGGWARPFRQPDQGAEASFYGPGDDAGAVRVAGGYLLLSGEVMRPDLLVDPEFAGFCAVTVNVNDVYAMGGRPLGLLAMVISGGLDDSLREGFLAGLSAGLRHYDIPLLGGHTSPEEGPAAVAVSIAGFARNLIRGGGASPGDLLVAGVDLGGRPHERLFAWDSVTSAEPKRTLEKLEALITVAENGLCSACRDISNPGILGTLAMMCEASGTGARVDLEAVPAPESVDLEWWLKAYPSLGFLFAAPTGRVDELGAVLTDAGIDRAVFGEVTEGPELVVESGGESAIFLDLARTPITGIF